jgi:hypothetical protein
MCNKMGNLHCTDSAPEKINLCTLLYSSFNLIWFDFFWNLQQYYQIQIKLKKNFPTVDIHVHVCFILLLYLMFRLLFLLFYSFLLYPTCVLFFSFLFIVFFSFFYSFSFFCTYTFLLLFSFLYSLLFFNFLPYSLFYSSSIFWTYTFLRFQIRFFFPLFLNSTCIHTASAV